MTTNRHSHAGAQKRALEWLRNNIQDGTWVHGDSLPSLESLSQSAGVARYTMWKAVRALCEEKTLSARRGSGIVLGVSEWQKLKDQQYSWQHIASLISDSIQSGDLSPGNNLPSISKLQLMHGVSYRTVRKALSILVQRRVLTRFASRYTVPRLAQSRASTEVVFVSEGTTLANEGLRAQILTSEREALKIGVSLTRFQQSYSEPIETVSLQRLIRRDPLAGFVIDCWGLYSENRARNFNLLLSSIYNAKKRIAVVDHTGDLELPEPFRSSERVCVISSAAFKAGEDVGRSLIAQGHKKIAFLTIPVDQHWSLFRYRGLARAFKSAGLGSEAVEVYPTIPLAGAAPAACIAAGMSRNEIESLFIPGMMPDDLAVVFKRSPETSRLLHLSPNEVEEVRRDAAMALRIGENSHADSLFEAIHSNLIAHISDRFIQRLLGPWFRNLLAKKGTSAWVAATDTIARMALRFLAEESIDVPGCVSIVGFDNSIDGAVDGLSSYDFDLHGHLHFAISFAADRPVTKDKKIRSFEWPGILYQRQSSGKAPQISIRKA